MASGSSIDWTQIILQVITTVGVVAVALIAAWMNRRVRVIREELQTPSGDALGAVAERTEHLAAANSAHLVQATLSARERDALRIQTAAELAEVTRATGEQTEAKLTEIHELVNDRLDRALETLADVRAELLALQKAREAENG